MMGCYVQSQSLPTEVPVLCYHQVRMYQVGDGKTSKAITVPPAVFAAHMKMLHDSGFQPILPDALYEYLTNNKPLPSKPILISFDDNTESQFVQAVPVLNRYGYKAVFFVMTVSLNKAGYMSQKQLQQLQQQGHLIAAHTWDHKNVQHFSAEDWHIQLDLPFKTLQNITGKPVSYFAYPYGSWNATAVQELQKRGIKLAFILHNPQSKTAPLLTVRRVMVVSSWSGHQLYQQLQQRFSNTK